MLRCCLQFKLEITEIRDYTIMLLLLETGMRVSELAGIKLEDIRWRENKILVLVKGNKERLVPFQRKMKTALQRYVTVRGDVPGVDNLFINQENLPMCTQNIHERITHFGITSNIAGVRVSPHTFRHTFAKMYIKNGGDTFSLQAILGHTTLDMVRNYVNMFSSNVQEQHNKFSFLEHLRI